MRAGRAAALAALCLAVAGVGPGAAADPVLPLADVRPGMVGDARTVVRGTEIVRFPVTVLDVLHAADAPGGTLILVRAEGPLMEETGGVAEGMSGSPVYVTGADGVARVMGALAFGAGDEAGVIAAVTPIERMLASSEGPRALARAGPPPRAARRPVVVADRAAAVRLQRRRPGALGLHPLARWSVAGVARARAGPLARHLRRSGIRLTSLGPRTIRPPVPLEPGATMSVLLAGGDLVLGAIGTVTWVDGTTVLGLGHPVLRAGRSRFLLADGYVFHTVAAPIGGSSYKLAEPGTLQGMVVGDRADGVTGALGPARGIAAVSVARDLDRGTRATVRATLAPDERTAPLVGGLLQDEAALRVRDGVGGGTLSLRVAIRSPALRRPIVYRNLFAAAGDVVSLASGQVPRLMAILMQNGLRPLEPAAVEVRQTLERRVRAARIVSARLRPARVRPGGRARLRLVVRPWRSAPRALSLPVRVPHGIGPGATSLRVVPGGPGGFDPLPAALDEEVGGELTPAALRAAAVRVERLAAGAPGPRLAQVLEGLRRATRVRNDSVRLLAPGEHESDPRAGVSVRVPYVVYAGRAAVRVRVP